MLPTHHARVAPPGALSPCGKYLLCGPLGKGGQADVVLALSLGMVGFSKLVVLKRLRPELAAQPELVTMFMDEARLAARLSHPNVVDTYEVGVVDGSYFIAMEHLDGQPLNRLRRRPGAGSLPHQIWARLVADALGALHYAHELCDYDGSPLGIVHRDVSPHNLFVTYDGRAKLVDFGIAKAALNNINTATGTLKGKVAYMAPEQIRGRADRRADVFAAGVVLWELLAGRKLFTGDTVQVLNQVLFEPVPRLASQLPEIDPELDAIVARAVEKDPDRRFQTAEAMREALDAYLARRGDTTCSAELARWMRASFENERESVRKQVLAAMEGATCAQLPPDNRAALRDRPRLPIWQPGDDDATLVTPPPSSFSVPPVSTPATASFSMPPVSTTTTASFSVPPVSNPTLFAAPVSVVPEPASLWSHIPPWQGLLSFISAGLLAAGIVAFCARGPVDAGAFAVQAAGGPISGLDGTSAPQIADAPGAGDADALMADDPSMALSAGPGERAPLPSAAVEVSSDPPGALVSWNGRPYGSTPARLELPLGEHTVVLVRAGYQTEALVVSPATPGDTLKRSVALAPLSFAAPACTPGGNPSRGTGHRSQGRATGDQRAP